MPNITLTWQASFGATGVQYLNFVWMLNLVWRRTGHNPLLPTGSGLYVITDGTDVVYAGKAGNIRNRFYSRSRVLREYDIDPTAANVVPNHRVYIATVNPATQLYWAEVWLVRILVIRDLGLPLQHIQNANLRLPFYSPAGGLQVVNNNRPFFIAVANYNYAAGVVV